ncbi:MAG: hypothetical protein LBQ38_05965 [Spirochaetaceae bacterium]|jgi:hypothetical protein|nr:hypothetical protein [Spirochaetaceae bacterium]
MNKNWYIPFAAGMLLLAGLSASCKAQLLPVPFSVEGGGGALAAPGNVTASQGKRRLITLSWEAVSGAVRYVLYRSESPLEEFVPCGETAGPVTGYEMAVQPGADLYFRVAALNNRDELSPKSAWVRGTSLARPEISDVMPDPTGPETVRVYWYMNNLESSTYKEDIRYTVYCFEGDAEKGQIPVDGSVPDDPFAVVGGLSPGMDYSFQVEAYLAGEPGMAETSLVWSGR